VVSLGKLGDKKAVPILIEALKDTNYAVRFEAAEALGKLGDNAAVPALIKALNQKDAPELTIAEALGKLESPLIVPALIRLFEKVDDGIKMTIIESLSEHNDERAIPILIQALHSSSKSYISETANETLLKIGLLARPQLIQALDHEDAQIRISSALLLIQMGDTSELRALTLAAYQAYPNETTAEVALKALRKKGRSITSGLIRLLKHEYYDFRAASALALGEVGDTLAVPHIINALQAEDYSIRASATKALGKLGDRSAIPALITILNHDTFNQNDAAIALIQLGDSSQTLALLFAVNQDDNEKLKQKARDILNTLGNTIVPDLIAIVKKDLKLSYSNSKANYATQELGRLKDKRAIKILKQVLAENDSTLRSDAVDALAQMGDKSTAPSLLLLLKNGTEEERAFAAHALGQLEVQSAVPALLEALKKEDYATESILFALVKLADISAVPTLLDALKKETTRESATYAIITLNPTGIVPLLQQMITSKPSERNASIFKILGASSDPAATSTLIEYLQDPSYETRSVALKHLGARKDIATVHALIKALEDPEDNIRFLAAESLGNAQNPKAIPALLKAFEQETATAKMTMASALVQLGETRNLSALLLSTRDFGVNQETHQRAQEALDKLRSQAIPDLILLLHDQHRDVRHFAAHRLLLWKDKSALPKLYQALKNKNANTSIHAAEALLILADQSSQTHLITALQYQHKRVRSLAAISLEKWGDKTAIPALKKALDKEAIELTKEDISNALNTLENS